MLPGVGTSLIILIMKKYEMIENREQQKSGWEKVHDIGQLLVVIVTGVLVLLLHTGMKCVALGTGECAV